MTGSSSMMQPRRDHHVPIVVADLLALLAPWEAAEEVEVHCGHQRSPVLLMLVAKHVWYLQQHAAALASRSEAYWARGAHCFST